MATDTVTLKNPNGLKHPGSETEQAISIAQRYCCEFVDLKTAKIDHDLFRTIPVDLMFRYHFVPMHLENGTLGHSASRSTPDCHDRRTAGAAFAQVAH